MDNKVNYLVYIKLNYNNFDKLLKRLQIFEKHCIPSLLNQTNQNFKVLINVNLDEKFYNLVKKYDKYENFYLSDLSINDFCKKIWDNYSNKILITTRLDSDDSLNINYIDSIYKLLKNKKIIYLININKNIIINFSMGIQLNTDNLSIRKRIYKIPNPFLTLISINGNHCRNYQHQIIHKFYYFINLNNKTPMWIQTIHSENILNNFIHGIEVGKFNSEINKHFKIKI